MYHFKDLVLAKRNNVSEYRNFVLELWSRHALLYALVLLINWNDLYWALHTFILSWKLDRRKIFILDKLLLTIWTAARVLGINSPLGALNSNRLSANSWGPLIQPILVETEFIAFLQCLLLIYVPFESCQHLVGSIWSYWFSKILLLLCWWPIVVIDLNVLLIYFVDRFIIKVIVNFFSHLTFHLLRSLSD